MNLTKEHWTNEDITPFQNYLKSLSKGQEKADMEKLIVNTALQCLAISCTNIDDIVKKIFKGNFLEFIDLWIWEYHANTVINGKLIGKIKDFDTMKTYLTKFSARADNWASTDSIKFNIKPKNEANFVCFAQELVNKSETFSRRLGLIILLKTINKNTIDNILSISKQLYNEEEYYVNIVKNQLTCNFVDNSPSHALSYLYM